MPPFARITGACQKNPGSRRQISGFSSSESPNMVRREARPSVVRFSGVASDSDSPCLFFSSSVTGMRSASSVSRSVN